MHRLHRRAARVRGICRSGVAPAPPGVEILAGDAADRSQTRRLFRDADLVYSCVEVDSQRWPELWPPILEGLLSAAAGGRLIFADNLHSFGPVDGSLTEDLRLTGYGLKPALRARMTEAMLAARAAGRLEVALVRAYDFFGPRVLSSLLGERVFPMEFAGRPAQLLADPDLPHSYTYVPDFARALVTVAESDDASGEIWHLPNAPARTTREVLKTLYRLSGHPLRLRVMPRMALGVLALLSPELRAMREMEFVWNRPYVVDHTKFATRLWGDYTPLEQGLQHTLDGYRARR